ncbi:hypothetical protein Mcate_01450 [Meiothermus taiwanensis]|jgi:hypothetical protein|uniref:Uncharacterized protein n=1 Tax=Meiothermus taiwanensis TaxID=172827 RepID=A0A399DYD9_9DEIN|nr:hypothetical protein Mcate_01450 [Meiothermus taiwanensis]
MGIRAGLLNSTLYLRMVRMDFKRITSVGLIRRLPVPN